MRRPAGFSTTYCFHGDHKQKLKMAEDVDSSTSLPKLAAESSEVPSNASLTKFSVEHKSDYDDEYEDEVTQLPTEGEVAEPMDDFMSDDEDDDTNLVVLDPNHVSHFVVMLQKSYASFIATYGKGPSCS